MTATIQFINSTGDLSNAAQKAQKKLVRSHAAAQRERSKRLRSRRTPLPLSYLQGTIPTASLCDIDSEVSLENGSKQTEYENNNNMVADTSHSTKPLSLVSVKRRQKAPHTTSLAVTNSHPLRLARESGELFFPLPVASPDRILGQGSRDWFVQMPSLITPRMKEHIHYCNVRPFSSSPSHLTASQMSTCSCPSSIHRIPRSSFD